MEAIHERDPSSGGQHTRNGILNFEIETLYLHLFFFFGYKPTTKIPLYLYFAMHIMSPTVYVYMTIKLSLFCLGILGNQGSWRYKKIFGIEIHNDRGTG